MSELLISIWWVRTNSRMLDAMSSRRCVRSAGPASVAGFMATRETNISRVAWKWLTCSSLNTSSWLAVQRKNSSAHVEMPSRLMSPSLSSSRPKACANSCSDFLLSFFFSSLSVTTSSELPVLPPEAFSSSVFSFFFFAKIFSKAKVRSSCRQELLVWRAFPGPLCTATGAEVAAAFSFSFLLPFRKEERLARLLFLYLGKGRSIQSCSN
mmetsp:Transcript_1097/g.2626  ORF Transcript_1097/g.2626 Transcript_1097/m.2626 type:complete len:210 (+) Transcript_1097:2224-2853(+)